MKYLIIILSALFWQGIPFVSYSQNKVLDSLKAVMEKSSEQRKAYLLAEISMQYISEPKKRKLYIDKALELAEKTGNIKAKSLAYNSLSYYYLNKNEFSKADSIGKLNLEIAFNSLDSISISNAYQFLASYYFKLADYNKAAVNCREALNYFHSGDKIKYYIIKKKYAAALTNISDYKNALVLLLDILEYHEQKKDTNTIINLYAIIGSVVLEMGDTHSAHNYFTKAIKLGNKGKYKTGLYQACYDLGYYYYYKEFKKIDSAKFYLHKAVKYAEEVNANMIIADANTALGAIYIDLNKLDSAVYRYKKVINLAEKINDKWAIVYGYMGLAKVYNKQQNYGKSLYLLYKVEPIATKLNAPELFIDYTNLFAETYAFADNYREAYYYMRLYNQAVDRLYKEKSAKELAGLKIQYETEKKERENKRLIEENKYKEQNIRNQKYISIAIALLLIMAIVFAFNFFQSREKIKKNNRLLKEKNNEILNQNEEIKLKSEEVSKAYIKLKELDEYKQGLTNMIIHDLKNPLNIILNMAESNLVKEAANKMFILVSDILDVAKLEEAKIKIDKKGHEIRKIAENAIRKTAFIAGVSGIEVINNIPEDIIVMVDKDLTERVFINLLSNAIKFSPQKSKIFINAEFDENNLKISVTDFGMGIPEAQLEHIFDKFVQLKEINSDTSRSTGLGLTFCKLAVEAQGGKIGVESSVNAGSTFWFTVELSK